MIEPKCCLTDFVDDMSIKGTSLINSTEVLTNQQRNKIKELQCMDQLQETSTSSCGY